MFYQPSPPPTEEEEKPKLMATAMLERRVSFKDVVMEESKPPITNSIEEGEETPMGEGEGEGERGEGGRGGGGEGERGEGGREG